MINRWLSVRLEMMGASIVFSAAFFVTVILPRNAGLVGLVVTAALNLTGELVTKFLLEKTMETYEYF